MNRTSEEILLDYSKNEPRAADFINPTDKEARKAVFLATSTLRNPGHAYDELREADFESQRSVVARLLSELETASDASELLTPTYQEYMKWGLTGFDLLQAAQRYNAAENSFFELLAGNDYMDLSRRYGVPERAVYHGIINDLQNMRGVELPTREHRRVYDELLGMLPSPTDPALTAGVQIDPVAQEWVARFVEVLYEDLLRHVPRQAEFTPAELVMWFTVIMRKAFGAAASDWRVVLGKCSSVSVSAHRKLIKVSPARANVSLAKMRGLVVHELGVHLMRALMGAETNIPVLAWGLPGYREAEEGVATVFEEALSREYKIRGVPLYLAASLAYLEEYDFRDVYERMWRFSFVTNHVNPAPMLIEKGQSVGYNRTNRIFRGTDRLPLLIDLAYYNGYVKVWRMLESVAGNEEHARTLLFLGKTNFEDDKHRRVALEASSA